MIIRSLAIACVWAILHSSVAHAQATFDHAHQSEAIQWMNAELAKSSPAIASESAPACANSVECCQDCGRNAAEPTPPAPYKGLFYANDFSYLDEPCAVRDDYFELLKRLTIAPGVKLDVGGEYRHQFKSEDRRGLLTGLNIVRDDSFTLHRLRVYGDLKWNNRLRAYIEYLDGVSLHEDLAPLVIDENRSDLINAFGEIRLTERLNARIGRQELLYGAQRLISPLDWANTRRTFEGAKLMYTSKCLDVDLFWTRPVLVNPSRFDSADQSRWFGGAYAKYSGFENFTISPYFLVLREEDTIRANVASPFGAPFTRGGFVGGGNNDNRVFTSGAQITGGLDDWLWDLEGAYQFGSYGASDISAGFVAAGIGRKLTSLPWNPVLWGWYDYASGDSNPADGTVNTFNQLLPLAHKYHGFIDLVARQNVHDINTQLILKPTKKLTLLAWLHFMYLAEAADGLYNVAGVISRQDPTGNSGSAIGQEIDLAATYNLRPGIDVQLGYSHFWSDDFVTNTGGANSAYLLYSQLSVKF